MCRARMPRAPELEPVHSAACPAGARVPIGQRPADHRPLLEPGEPALGHRGQLVAAGGEQPFLGLPGVLGVEQGERRADQEGLLVDLFVAEEPVGVHHPAGPRQLLVGRRLGHQAAHLGEHQLLDPRRLDPRDDLGGHHRAAVAAALAEVGGGPDAELAVVDQRAVQPARAAAAGDVQKQAQQRMVGMAGVRAGRGDQHPGHLALAPLDSGGRSRRRREIAEARRRLARRQLAEAGVDRGEGHLGLDVADHHHHRVGRLVVALVERAQLLGADLAERLAGAQHGFAVGVLAVEGGVHRLVERVPGIALVHRDLFEDHLALGLHLGLVEQEALEPVELEVERSLPAVGRGGEVVDGRVVAGEGVVDPAQRAGDPVDLAEAVAGRALEHHVLEEMGGAAQAGRFVGAAGAVDDGGGNHRRAPAFEHRHGEAAGQGLDQMGLQQAAERRRLRKAVARGPAR